MSVRVWKETVMPLKHPRKLQADIAFRLTDAIAATTVLALLDLATQTSHDA